MTQIYIDIETTGNAEMIPFLPEPTPPKNYKKPEAIARWLTEAKEKQVTKAALDLDAARIISIAVAKNCGAPEGWTLNFEDRQDESREGSLIDTFWGWIEKSLAFHGDEFCFVGYNLRNFDLPILLRRTWQFGLEPPLDIAPMLNRGNVQVIDLMEALYHNGYTGTRYRGLKAVCQMYGIYNPLPDVDGSMASEMDASELLVYNLNDVALTQELAQRTEGYYWFR